MLIPDGHTSFWPDGTRLRHFKGGDYVVVCHASHSETGEDMVVYRCLQSDITWVRPAAMFYDEATPGVRRFTPVED